MSPREAALLKASATIYAGLAANGKYDAVTADKAQRACVEGAYALLDLITAREKAAYQTREKGLRHCKCHDTPGDSKWCVVHCTGCTCHKDQGDTATCTVHGG